MPPLLALLLLAPSAAMAYGEVVDGFGSPEERALHFFTDRLRVEPDATDLTFSDYDPVRPLIYALELNEAARFYADDMAANGCFPADHSSCDGTTFADRLRSFYDGGAFGENIQAGRASPRAAVFEGWLYSDGHRENMLSPDWNELGTGHALDGHHWVQDFGFRGEIDEPIATSGTHWPLLGSANAETHYFVAVHDPEGPVDSVQVWVDGTKYSMEVDRGSGDDRTYLATVENLGERCREYWFEVSRADGSIARYPSTGKLLAPVGTDCDPWIEGGGETEGDSLGSAGVGCNEDAESRGADSNTVDGNVQLGQCAVGGPPGSVLFCLLALFGRRRR